MIAPGDAFALYAVAPGPAGKPESKCAFGVVLSAGPELAYVELQSRQRWVVPLVMVEAGKGLLASIATEVVL